MTWNRSGPFRYHGTPKTVIRLARTLLRRPALVLLATAALTVFLGWHALGSRVDFSVSRLYGSASPERLDYDAFRRDYGSDDFLLYVGFRSAGAWDSSTRETLESLRTKLAAVEGVRGTFSLLDALEFYRGFPVDARREVASSPLYRGTLFSEDGAVVCLWVLLREDLAGADARRRTIEAVRAALPGPDFHLSGLPVVENEYIELSKRDLRTFMPLAAGLFVVLLAIYFRSLAGTLLPLLAVGVAVAWTLGLLEILGVSLSILSSLIPNLILVLAMADAVHVLARHREDLAVEPDRREAMVRTLVHMIPACFLTSVTTAVGFASLGTAPVGVVREFGLATAGGIMIGYIVVMTFLPAAAGVLPRMPARAACGAGAGRFLGWVAGLVEKRRGLLWAAAVLGVALSVPGLLKLRLESSWLHDLQPSNPVHRAHVFFDEHLAGVSSVDLRIEGPVRDLGWLRKVEAFQAEVAAWKGGGTARVRHAAGFADLVKELDLSRKRGLPRTPEDYDVRLRLLESVTRERAWMGRMADAAYGSCRLQLRMRGMSSRGLDAFHRDVTAMASKAGLKVSLTGKTWVAKRSMDRVVLNMLWGFGLAAAPIFGSMALLFRSLRVGLLSVIPNLLPMIGTAGFMGWMGIDLNFSTVTVFSISLGIAVDTTIHYLSRLRTELEVEPDPVRAMRRALSGAGGPMIFGTLLLILGFGSILTSSFNFTFHFGLLGLVALVLALLCDLFLTPTLFLSFRPWARSPSASTPREASYK